METRTYEITGNPDQLDVLERALAEIETLGVIGASRAVTIHVDGDGAARIKVRKKGQDKPLDSSDIHYSTGNRIKRNDEGDTVVYLE